MQIWSMFTPNFAVVRQVNPDLDSSVCLFFYCHYGKKDDHMEIHNLFITPLLYCNPGVGSFTGMD